MRAPRRYEFGFGDVYVSAPHRIRELTVGHTMAQQNPDERVQEMATGRKEGLLNFFAHSQPVLSSHCQLTNF